MKPGTFVLKRKFSIVSCLQTWVFWVQCLAASIDSSEFCIKFGHWNLSDTLPTKYVDAIKRLL